MCEGWRAEPFSSMNEFEQLARDVRGFATEVRQLCYSSVLGGHENPFLELSERMNRSPVRRSFMRRTRADL
jgi:hypothetical protein